MDHAFCALLRARRPSITAVHVLIVCRERRPPPGRSVEEEEDESSQVEHMETRTLAGVK